MTEVSMAMLSRRLDRDNISLALPFTALTLALLNANHEEDGSIELHKSAESRDREGKKDQDPRESPFCLCFHSLCMARSSGKSSVLESVAGKDFLPRGSGIVTRHPLVLQLHRIDEGKEYAEFIHLPKKKFTDLATVRKEIADETDRETSRSKQISTVPIYLSLYSPMNVAFTLDFLLVAKCGIYNFFISLLCLCGFAVVNLTLIDLPGLTKVAIDGQSESIVQDIENMVRSYIEKVITIQILILFSYGDYLTQ
ncbi:hypothetical protein HYC85_000615 [Camellia sinensis]|uniref:Dynamin-type G domain-containing protein n=1 Tax=Camellia sinensis TaxID=4442 RepID=A0A7J7I4I6_CAMSI|nr:hypothetical protein HYC85_000615 [Camellia sinensis]